MKVVLTQDVKGLGKKGELINASDGYCRNYLLPRKLAVEANKQAMSELKNRESAESPETDLMPVFYCPGRPDERYYSQPMKKNN